MSSSTYHAYDSKVLENTRFNHCTGVMHMAGRMVEALRKQGAEIDERTGHLIQLGGLLHDAGHFAFSHLFDVFLKTTPNVPTHIPRDHEERSVNAMLVINNQQYPDHRLSLAKVKFVANVIMGEVPPGSKAYLYEIVCAGRTGVDVDKMDYLARDDYYTLGMGHNFDSIIEGARIGPDNHIVFAENARSSVMHLFELRQHMYVHVYHHPITRVYEKVRLCAMRRAAKAGIIILNADTDANLELQIGAYLQPLIEEVTRNRAFHECELCADFKIINAVVHQSGSVDRVTFI